MVRFSNTARAKLEKRASPALDIFTNRTEFQYTPRQHFARERSVISTVIAAQSVTAPLYRFKTPLRRYAVSGQ